MRRFVSALAVLCTLIAAPALAAAATSAASAAPPSDDVIRQKIVGSWGQTPACAEGHLTFKSDGTFASKGADEVDGVTGSYAVDHGRLTGKNGDNTMPDELVDKAVQAIILNARSGKIGDGKIFLTKIDEAIRIRNDERGAAAL